MHGGDSDTPTGTAGGGAGSVPAALPGHDAHTTAPLPAPSPCNRSLRRAGPGQGRAGRHTMDGTAHRGRRLLHRRPRLTHRGTQLRRQALILRNVRACIIVTDRAGRITEWNDGATALFGYTAAEMLGR